MYIDIEARALDSESQITERDKVGAEESEKSSLAIDSDRGMIDKALKTKDDLKVNNISLNEVKTPDKPQ